MGSGGGAYHSNGAKCNKINVYHLKWENKLYKNWLIDLIEVTTKDFNIRSSRKCRHAMHPPWVYPYIYEMPQTNMTINFDMN